MPDTTATPALATALLKAQMTSRGVTKDKSNDFHRYRYASTEALILEAQECLHGAGLSLHPVGGELVTVAGSAGLVVPPDKGGPLLLDHITLIVLRRRWRLTHSSGESIEWSQDWPVVPERGRPFDKATAAADTASLGYTLRDLLLLARVEKGTDLDDDERDEPKREPKKRDTGRTGTTSDSGERPQHHPSFREDYKRFMAELNKLGLVYDDVAAWCVAKGWGRPSTWEQSNRDGLLADLKKPESPQLADARAFAESTRTAPPTQ